MKSVWKYIFGIIGLSFLALVLAGSSASDDKLHLITCDVGQGDAILAVYKGNQILIDGGPDRRVLDCLAKYMPFWDKKIELVILTHPQDDHYGGLVEVFRSYEVDTFVANQVDSSTAGYRVLKNLVEASGVRVVNPTNNTSFRLGLLYLDIVHPSSALADDNKAKTGKGVLGAFTSSKNLNDYSVVAILSLGEFDALLTGDIGPNLIPEILARGEIKDVEYIKVPHHGSKNGLTQELLERSKPEVAVISVGRNNRYGHPHEEVLKMLNDENIKTLRTDELGDVEIETDGDTYSIKQ